MAENSNTKEENSNTKEEVAVTITEGINKSGGAVAKPVDRLKNLNGILRIFSFILSFPVIASVIWLLYMRDFECENLLRLPKFQIGICVGLIFVFLISNIVVFMRTKLLAIGLVVVIVPLIVMFTMGLAFVGAYKMESHNILGTPMWLENKVNDANSWNNIKSCIYDTIVCDDLASRTLALNAYDFSMTKLSPLESGCCKPPEICEMNYINATFWSKGDGSMDQSSVHDSDCDTWMNDQNILCYNCQSCKQGFLKMIESKWWKLGVFMVVMALLLIVCHILLFITTMLETYVG